MADEKEAQPEERQTRREQSAEELHARYRLNPVTGEQEQVNPGDPGYDNLEPTPEQTAHYQESVEEGPVEHAAAVVAARRSGPEPKAGAKPDEKRS